MKPRLPDCLLNTVNMYRKQSKKPNKLKALQSIFSNKLATSKSKPDLRGVCDAALCVSRTISH